MATLAEARTSAKAAHDVATWAAQSAVGARTPVKIPRQPSGPPPFTNEHHRQIAELFAKLPQDTHARVIAHLQSIHKDSAQPIPQDPSGSRSSADAGPALPCTIAIGLSTTGGTSDDTQPNDGSRPPPTSQQLSKPKDESSSSDDDPRSRSRGRSPTADVHDPVDVAQQVQQECTRMDTQPRDETPLSVDQSAAAGTAAAPQEQSCG